MKGSIQERQNVLSSLYPQWRKQTIWNAFAHAADCVPEQEFLYVDGRGSFTYAQTRAAALQIANGLWAQGVRAGDHVAIQTANSPEQVFTALALAALRVVKIPVNPQLGEKELAYVLKQSDSSCFITDREFTVCIEEDCPGLKKVIRMNGGQPGGRPIEVAWSAVADSGYSGFQPDASGHGDEPSDIVYTSGSTSAPKGVLLTHDMLLRSAFASCMNRGFEIGRRIYVPLPMFHVYGYVEGLLTAILVRGTVLLRPGKFQPKPAVEFMQRTGANDILSVPVQMVHLIQYLREEPAKLPELHAVYCSASICPTWVWPAIRRELGVSDVITGYGMSEVCGASTQTSPMDSDRTLMFSVGRLLPGGCSGLEEWQGHQIQYRVVDPVTGMDAEPGEPGELWCRGPVVTKEYYNRPEINAAAFTEDGWFKTGDSGRFDDNGYLILYGRLDDMYKINGENVSPKFLADSLSECQVIGKVEVLGVPDETHGYVGMAFIQLTEDTAPNRAKAEQFAREHLAGFQIPKYFVYMKDGEWPQTPTGKVKKDELRRMAQEYLNKQHAVPKERISGTEAKSDAAD